LSGGSNLVREPYVGKQKAGARTINAFGQAAQCGGVGALIKQRPFVVGARILHTFRSAKLLFASFKFRLGGSGGSAFPAFLRQLMVGAAGTYFLLPLEFFVIELAACGVSFYAHVFFDKEYHKEGSSLQRFAWFRRKQELHFVHHRHTGSNFAVIDFFWDRMLGTYRDSGTE
jgi:hypothetical protein